MLVMRDTISKISLFYRNCSTVTIVFDIKQRNKLLATKLANVEEDKASKSIHWKENYVARCSGVGGSMINITGRKDAKLYFSLENLLFKDNETG